MVNIKVDKDFKQLFPLVVGSLVYSPIKIYHNMLVDRDLVLSELRGKAGIYLIHNLVNSKQYVGSSKNLRKRLLYYYSPSSLLNNQYVSRSILKYGHDNFSLVILEFVEIHEKLRDILLSREQFYIDSLKPILNILPTAGSILGYKHSNETKELLSKLKIGMKLSEETKQRLSRLFSGELNPFWGKTHNLDSLMRIKLSKIGELNPMFGKEKSSEFIEQMYRDKSGENNPM
jgi:group I intron endonuclease